MTAGRSRSHIRTRLSMTSSNWVRDWYVHTTEGMVRPQAFHPRQSSYRLMTKALAFTPEFLRISYYYLRVTDYRLATTTDILPKDTPVKSYGATCRKTSTTSVMAFLAKTPLRSWMSKIERTVAARGSLSWVQIAELRDRQIHRQKNVSLGTIVGTLQLWEL